MLGTAGLVFPKTRARAGLGVVLQMILVLGRLGEDSIAVGT